MEANHKYNLGIVGNCSFLAYIDTRAAVQWLCFPRFDSSFVFGGLVDPDKGGEFSVSPKDGSAVSTQYYLPNTNILVTEFRCSDGAFRVVDFAPRFRQFDRYYRPLMLIRKLEPISGTPCIGVRCRPVGDYGNFVPETVTGSNHIRYLHFESHVRLTTDVPLSYILLDKPFALNGCRYLVFTYGVPLEAPIESTCETFLDRTQRYWIDWIKATSIPTIYQEETIRSALVLKLHQYEDTGGIIASGTTSLPESPGSGRNWDYRYCWMRDAFYTLNAFNSIGHFEEVEQYFNYIHNIILNEKESISPMYTISGDRVASERSLDLSGFLGNRPVRVGNDASSQKQNDIFGQVLVSLLPLYADRRLAFGSVRKSLTRLDWLVDRIAAVIDEPDAGIWEFRNSAQFHSYTYLFHWVGSQAAYRIAKIAGASELRKKAAKLIIESAKKIEASYNQDLGAYTQAGGIEALDASSLHLITMKYLNPNSDRAKQHLAAVEAKLKSDRGLVYRYVHADDFGKPETGFFVCSFWYVEALACVGRVEDAFEALTALTKYANHLGLFSEDIHSDGGQWGNFPQTYSHVGLMNAVHRLASRIDKPIFFGVD